MTTRHGVAAVSAGSVGFYSQIFTFPQQAHTFMQLLDGDDTDEKAVTAMGILNTLETMLHVMDASKEVSLEASQEIVIDPKRDI